MPDSRGMTLEALRITERWDHFSPFLRPLGGAFFGTFSQGLEEDRIVEELSAFSARNRIMSTGLPRLSTFTTESRSITYAPSRETTLCPRLAKNTVNCIFSLQRWRSACTFSTRS